MSDDFVMLYDGQRYVVSNAVMRETNCVVTLPSNVLLLVSGPWRAGRDNSFIPNAPMVVNRQAASHYKQYNVKRS